MICRKLGEGGKNLKLAGEEEGVQFSFLRNI